MRQPVPAGTEHHRRWFQAIQWRHHPQVLDQRETHPGTLVPARQSSASENRRIPRVAARQQFKGVQCLCAGKMDTEKRGRRPLERGESRGVPSPGRAKSEPAGA